MGVALGLVGASIFLLLGIAHAVFTLQSRPESGPMMPTDPKVLAAMHEVSGLGLAPEIETSLYKAWIGFNFSHSLGVVAIASIMLVQILSDFGAAIDQPWFLILVGVAPALYCLLAVKYWFNEPRVAIAFASLLLWAGVVVELV